MRGSWGALVRILIGCVFICCCVVHVNGCVEEERRALLDIKHSLDLVGYNNSTVLEDWVIGDGDCCNWTGVKCGNSSYHHKVISITLDNVREGFISEEWYPNASLFAQFMELEELSLGFNGIAGFVDPHGFKNMRNLEWLALSENHIKRVDPWISNITSLRTIVLSFNMIKEFPSGFMDLQNLEFLDLFGNHIERVDPLFSNITSLQQIDLSSNMIKEFPSGLCRIQNLQVLILWDNLIEGNIDTCLRNLVSLEWLDLSDNQLNGVFSFSLFANLSNLSYVDLSNNYQLEVETESPFWVPSFQLAALRLRNCLLNKHSGWRVPSFLLTQYNLKTLNLSNSSIIVSNPFELINNVTFLLILSHNTFLSPLFWTIQNKSLSLEILDLSESHISGIFHQNLTIFFPNLEYLNLSGNAFQGSIPSSLGVHKLIRVLDLSRNNFTGDMFSENLNLQHIQYLFLHDNHLTGSISRSLLNCSSLKLLDVRNNFLSDAIPSWLFDFPNMRSLLLSGNKFKGSIPAQVCQMQNLHILDLSNNNLSGIIPNCLNNITFWIRDSPSEFSIYFNFINYTGIKVTTDLITKGKLYNFMGDPLSLMTAIDLSMNMLSGPIPMEMGYLRTLHSLNLSHNNLTGSIPESFQNLMSLESMDLSFNHLSSEIPPQLAQLHTLSTFRVAYNNLSGIIPSNGQFSTFNASDFEGNPNLCGLVVGRSCSNGTSETHRITNDEVDKQRVIDSPVIYYSFIAASHAIGFWGVIAVLAFKYNWRVKLFLAADDLIYACGTGISILAGCVRKCIRK